MGINEHELEITEINKRMQKSLSCRMQIQNARQVGVNPQLILEFRDQTVGP